MKRTRQQVFCEERGSFRLKVEHGFLQHLSSDVWIHHILAYIGHALDAFNYRHFISPTRDIPEDYKTMYYIYSYGLMHDRFSLLLSCKTMKSYTEQCNSFRLDRCMACLRLYNRLHPELPSATFLSSLKGRTKNKSEIKLDITKFKYVDQCASEQYVSEFCQLMKLVSWKWNDLAMMKNNLKHLSESIWIIYNNLCSSDDLLMSSVVLYLPYLRNSQTSDGEYLIDLVTKRLSHLSKTTTDFLIKYKTILLLLAEYDLKGFVKNFKEYLDRFPWFLENVLTVQPLLFAYSTEWSRKYRELFLSAVKKHENLFQYAETTLKNDVHFVTDAMRYNPLILRYADQSLRNYKNLVMSLLKIAPHFLQCVPSSLRDDVEIVETALRSDIYGCDVFKYASERIRGTEVCKQLLHFPNVTQFIADPLVLSDKDVAAAVFTGTVNCKRASSIFSSFSIDTLRQLALGCVYTKPQPFAQIIEKGSNIFDRDMLGDLIIQAAQVRGGRLSNRYTPSNEAIIKLCNWERQELAIILLASSWITVPMLKEFTADRYINDREFVLKVVSLEPITDETLWKNRFADDEEIVRTALSGSWSAYTYASERLQHNKQIVLHALNKDAIIYDVPEQFKFDFDVVVSAVREDDDDIEGLMLQLPTWLSNKEFVVAACRKNKDVYNYVDPHLKDDLDVLTAAVMM